MLFVFSADLLVGLARFQVPVSKPTRLTRLGRDKPCKSCDEKTRQVCKTGWVFL